MTSDELRGFISAMKTVNGEKDFVIFFEMLSYDRKKDPDEIRISFMATNIFFVGQMFYGILRSESDMMYGAFRCEDIIGMTTDNPKAIFKDRKKKPLPRRKSVRV